MSRLVPSLAILAVLLLAACGSGEPSTDATGSAAPTDQALTGADLSDGVAAEVGDTEIDSERLESRVDAALESPQLASQIEDPEQARPQIRASVLSQMILTEAILQSAEEEGIEVTDEQIDEQRTQLEQQAGGADALQEQIDVLGFSDQELDQELRSLAVLDQVAEREAPSPAPTASPAADQADPQQRAVQEWLRQHVSGMQIVVDQDYGRWDAERLQVIPPQPAVQPGAPTPAASG